MRPRSTSDRPAILSLDPALPSCFTPPGNSARLSSASTVFSGFTPEKTVVRPGRVYAWLLKGYDHEGAASGLDQEHRDENPSEFHSIVVDTPGAEGSRWSSPSSATSCAFLDQVLEAHALALSAPHRVRSRLPVPLVSTEFLETFWRRSSR